MSVKEKTVDDRLQECINIRRQLQSLGVMQYNDIYKHQIVKSMNDFVTNGISNSFQVPLEKYTLHIILSNTRKSGITLLATQ